MPLVGALSVPRTDVGLAGHLNESRGNTIVSTYARSWGLGRTKIERTRYLPSMAIVDRRQGSDRRGVRHDAVQCERGGRRALIAVPGDCQEYRISDH